MFWRASCVLCCVAYLPDLLHRSLPNLLRSLQQALSFPLVQNLAEEKGWAEGG